MKDLDIILKLFLELYDYDKEIESIQYCVGDMDDRVGVILRHVSKHMFEAGVIHAAKT